MTDSFTFSTNNNAYKKSRKRLRHHMQIQLLLMYSQALEIKQSEKYGNLFFINN